MFRLKWQAFSSLFLSLLLMLGTVGLLGCDRDRVEVSSVTNIAPKAALITTRQLSETSPPKVIQELNKILDQYQPQVKILSPQPGETLTSTTVEVKLNVQDLPTFQDPEFKLGPHLHLIVDNNPYLAIYDPSQPYTLSDLTPGTHTLRVFASRPWHESFKNEGAYAQVTFNVITQTGENSPDPELPVLTFSRPKGEFGAEPIMLDYYLANAPLHWAAQEDAEDEIADWRIRVTINGESFIVDRWQPIYLKGFKEGDNWIQLEFLDENGDRVDNVFNNTVRLITYHPQGQDTLSKLTRGELSVEQVRQIVDPTYTPPATAADEVSPGELAPTETIPVDETITTEPSPQPSPEVIVPLEETGASAAPETSPPTTEPVAPEAKIEAEIKPQESLESSSEPIPTNLEPIAKPTALEPVPEPTVLAPETEAQPATVGEPIREASPSPEPAIQPEPGAAPGSLPEIVVPDAIAPALDSPASAKPESATETLTSSLDKRFEQKSIPEKNIEPEFPDVLENPPVKQSLSPGIRYFEEEPD